MEHRQVLTEHDWFNAVFDYMIEQLDGRFRLQFPEYQYDIDRVIENMNDPLCRASLDSMKYHIGLYMSLFGTTLTSHLVGGCPEEHNHEFLREYINLVWDSHTNTANWLTEQGIVPGQSAN